MARTPYAAADNMAALKAAADRITEESKTVTYLGFCSPGTTAEDQPNWSILKIVQSGLVYPFNTSFLWAKGLCAFHLQYSERATYEYTFRNF